jgi:peptidoglycan hydrolase-like protein with peptidoglycan-binding domain
MSLLDLIEDPRIARIICHPDDSTTLFQSDLKRFFAADASLTRDSAGESGIKAVQRLLIFLGYSTSASGAFAIDGDFGRGTNRGVAQFKVEHGLGDSITRATLCYPCQWNTARMLINRIPDTPLTPVTLETMLQTALQRVDTGRIACGNFNDAIFHLNALDKHQYLDCRQILARYGQIAETASQQLQQVTGTLVRPEWILSIIRQETAGVIRPRFEQHYLSRLNRQQPATDLQELRMQSMSMGLGQIMGTNYKRVGARNAMDLYTASTERQVGFVARFIGGKRQVVSKSEPRMADFRELARYYNGPKYEAHHYHERLSRWFNEFRLLMR